MNEKPQGKQRLSAAHWAQSEFERSYPYPIRLVSYAKLKSYGVSPNSKAICVNRESTWEQDSHHNNVIPSLEEACEDLGIERIGTFRFTVSGVIAPLVEDFNLFDAEDDTAFSTQWSYFDKLEKV